VPSQTYHFALKVTDHGGNRSDISNPVSVNTTGTPTVTLTLREGLNGYFGTEDATMIDFRPNDNLGGSTNLGVGKHGSEAPLVTDIQRALIRFDLDQVPAGVEILAAELQLYNYETEPSASYPVGAYRLVKHWVEGTRSAPEPEVGASSWNAAQAGTLDWSTPGADAASDNAQNDDPDFDRYETPEDVATLSGASTWYEWDLTDAVQHWVDGDWNNEGVIITAVNEADDSRRKFHSSEAVASQTLRPTLIVTFATPEIGVADPGAQAPVAARLSAAYPNPFAATTTIQYELTTPGSVQLRVFDVQGRVIRVLVDGYQPSGAFAANWDGLAQTGARAASGIYFYRLEMPGIDETRKVVLAN
jgi:hypothetical protein